MRCGELPSGINTAVEAGAAHLVFSRLRTARPYEIRDLEAIALRDPVLAGSLLGVANSALFGRTKRVSTVGRAIASIGVIAARKVMLAAAMRPLFALAGLDRIWTHSLSSAPLCSALAGHTGLLSLEEGLILGLVHDIGAVAVQFLPRETLETHRNLVGAGCPSAYVERLLLGPRSRRDRRRADCGVALPRRDSSTPCASIISRSAPHRNSRPWPIWRSSGPGSMRTCLPSDASRHAWRASS